MHLRKQHLCANPAHTNKPMCKSPSVSIHHSIPLHHFFTHSENPSKLKVLQYIGAEGRNVTFSDVPINPDVDFNFILSFAIDYSNSSPPSLTYGDFHFFRQGPPSKHQGGEESWQ